MISYSSRHSLYRQSETATAQRQGFSAYLGRQAERAGQIDGEDPSSNQVARVFTVASQTKLKRLRELQENWDGAGSLAPIPAAVANASARLPELYRASAAVGAWREPHVSASDEGEVTFEWWCGPRKITTYFGAERVELIRVWGENIDTEMELSQLFTMSDFGIAWMWLYGN